ncbi:alpha/beta hydrolase [Clostridium thermarum]|uniref:alpha/beta hydrolase n=1 Tax=Clostridium thermarum TaxID=1716543 RepID=UPI0011230E1B|nr:alpha/beta hydrolase [Clostridium thermarum]
MEKEFDIYTQDGKRLHMYKWDNANNIKGVVQLVHGSCEHAGRYEDICEFLNSRGYIVYAHDHRGHGKTEDNIDDLGFFAEEKGWEKLIEDLKLVNDRIHQENPGKQVIMLGHSMGSFLARHYAILYGTTIDALILSGTAHNPRLLLRLGLFAANLEIKRRGPKFRSQFIYKMSYDSFNKGFKPARTKCDWLSTDKKEVDKFLADERCGFVFTAAAFKDMFKGLLFITDHKNISKMRKNLPVLIISGKDDQVGGRGKMVRKTCNVFTDVGIKDITLRLYEGMRHEIFNEIEKLKVFEDMLNWMDERIDD